MTKLEGIASRMATEVFKKLQDLVPKCETDGTLPTLTATTTLVPTTADECGLRLIVTLESFE